MISRDAFAQEVRSLTDTAFAVAYLILGNRAEKRESFRAWFLRILRNEAYDTLRKRRRLTPVEELPEGPAPENDSAGRLDLKAALARLTEDQRTSLLLQQEGYALEEIAEALDVPVGTVKSRLARAKSTLRTLLEEDYNGKEAI